jgi:hypothetical protein
MLVVTGAGQHDWFWRFCRARSGSPDSVGWTDNLSVKSRPGRTLEELVADIFAVREECRQHELVIAHLRKKYGLQSKMLNWQLTACAVESYVR